MGIGLKFNPFKKPSVGKKPSASLIKIVAPVNYEGERPMGIAKW